LAAGIENLVIGSALFQPGKMKENIRAFQQLIAAFESQTHVAKH
jgi:pentose-5-phosphate-3-epimerase